jgi:riboflavin kinase
MISVDNLACLKQIGLLGGISGSVLLNSQMLGEELGFSPQTASRRLKDLELAGLLERTLLPHGQEVTLTEVGVQILREEHAVYHQIFQSEPDEWAMLGTVTSGLGEGAYYIGLEPYCVQFRKNLGFRPYPGTLNIQLTPAGTKIRKNLHSSRMITISGFESDGRTFGEVLCYPCIIEHVQCGIVIPGRSHYPDSLIEVIAPVQLREVLSLTDGDEVSVHVAV